MDLEPCIADLPLSPNPLLHSSFPYSQQQQHGPGASPAYLHQGAAFPTLMSRCNSSTLLTNLGLMRYGGPRQQQQQGAPPSQGAPCPGGQGEMMIDPSGGGGCGGCSRPYRSMENLNWNNVQQAETPGLYGVPYRSVDSEFIFHCTATTSSHWGAPMDGSNKVGYYGAMMPNPESLAFYPRRRGCLPPRTDLPLFPQWLFPGGVDEWEARKGLRDKLRLQSAARSSAAAEPLKPQHPLRPSLVVPGTVQAPPCDRDGGPPPPHVPTVAVHCRPMQCAVRRITSPEDIKQEVLRRLQLRRQNSSPNLLALHHHGSPERPEEGLLKTSYTTDNIAAKSAAAAAPAPEPRRPPTGRLHIPTFEEFKRMRQQECGSGTTASEKAEEVQLSAVQPDAETTAPSGRSDAPPPPSAFDGERGERGGERTGPRTGGEGGHSSETPPLPSPPHCTLSPIRTGPAPRSPLQTEETPATAMAAEEGEEEGRGCVVEPRRSSLEPAGISVPLLPHHHSDHSSGVSWERPASCCPALLLEGSELSRYGAKIYKMKDGLIGSALDLIKKSCSAESPADETPVRVSGDREGGGGGGGGGSDITAPPTTHCQSSPVSMATAAAAATACGATEEEEEASDETAAGGEEPAECQHPGLGCRRSSSDAAYELARTARSQRECRLRPHYSDPMPADAAKRKQLEMKIAAAARLHSQRRDRERDRDRDSAPAAVRGRSEPRGEERQGGGLSAATRSGQQQHRWSTVSSLSADSGVVGLSDEREEDDCGEPRRNHHHHHNHHHRRSRGGVDVERADSGIGPGLGLGGGPRGWKRPSASLRAWEAQRPCPDCGQRDLGGGGGGASRELRNGEGVSSMCERCSKLRTERKEAILEFLNTESSYGEDLRIIREEFYCPMQSAGLLTAEHLTVVFGNVQELIEVNERFTEHLQDSIDQAFDQGDEDLLTVYIGEIFLEFVNMLPAFQTYCLQQSTSVNMLNTLEKEKELLRIFLDASQNDNTALRRMNLRSFLMAPLQRVTKYPLLLSRISKATTECHPDHGRLREAKSRVESHLEHINMKTKQEGGGGGGGGTGTGGGGVTTWSLRSFRRDSRKNREVINIEMREVSMKTVGWARENTRFVMEGALQLSQPADGQWVKKGSKALKFQNVQSLLMVRTQRGGTTTGEGGPELGNIMGDQGDRGGGTGETVWDGVLVLIKDKSSGKFTVLREPIRLGNCVVSAEPDCEDTFEVLDIRRESFVFRATDKSRTQQWFRQIKRYARDLGPWRKRRNALPNIMINTNQTRS